MSEVPSNRLQSRVLLPFARVVMLWAAGAAFFVTLGGFAIGVLLYAQGSYAPTPPEVPPPQIDPAAAWDPAGFVPEVEYKIVNVDRNRLSVGDTVAQIYSAHDLDPIAAVSLVPTAASNRFAIVAAQPASSGSSGEFPVGKFKVTASAKLLEDLTDPDRAQTYPLSFVVAFPKERKTSDTRLDFTLVFPATRLAATDDTRPAPQPPQHAPGPPVPTSEAARAAQAIALIIDPLRTPTFFAAYQRALRQIESCGPDTESYAAVLNRQIEVHRQTLRKHNALRFEQRICALWRTAAANFAQQEAARQTAIAQAAAEALGKRATSMIALYVAGSALATFLMLALALALLAIENHVRVIREDRSA